MPKNKEYIIVQLIEPWSEDFRLEQMISCQRILADSPQEALQEAEKQNAHGRVLQKFLVLYKDLFRGLVVTTKAIRDEDERGDIQ